MHFIEGNNDIYIRVSVRLPPLSSCPGCVRSILSNQSCESMRTLEERDLVFVAVSNFEILSYYFTVDASERYTKTIYYLIICRRGSSAVRRYIYIHSCTAPSAALPWPCLPLASCSAKEIERGRIQRKRRSLAAVAFAGGFLLAKVRSAHTSYDNFAGLVLIIMLDGG